MANIAQLLTEHMDIWTAAETEKKSGRGRVGGNGGSVYGVKKLRELILELAVRGKLVPQDPNDKPASELLKRIQTEKAKLIAEGKIKKEKPLAPITNDEKPFELPQGWEWLRLGNLFTFEYGDNLPEPKRTNTGEYPVYGSNGIVGTHNECFVHSKCIVIGRKGSAGALNLSLSEGCCVTDVAYYCVPPTELDLIFTFKLFHTLGLDELGKGIKPGLNRNEAYELVIAIPPLAEQHRIVAKVDALMALCNQLEQQHSNAQEAHETLVSQLLATLTQSQNATEFNANWQRIDAHFDLLFTTEASIDALKQTLLQLAVMGKLVPQDPNDEPASELLKRIQAEKARLMAEGKLKKEKPLAPITEDEKPFELPQGWEWVRLGLTGLIGSSSRIHQKDWTNSGVPFYRAREIVKLAENGFVDNELFINEELFETLNQTSIIPEPHDIMITGVGTIGVPYVVKPHDKFYFKDASVLIFKNFSNLYTGYLNHFFLSPIWNKKIHSESMGTTVHTLTIERAKDVLIPLPPLAEQHRIVAKVDALMALCDQLKTRIQQAGQQQQAIADALVAQALLPQSAEVIDFVEYRTAVACYTIKKMCSNPAFGRTQVMKLLYLAQSHVGIPMQMQFEREAAGPLDKWIYEFERLAESKQWFKVVEKSIGSGKTKFEYQITPAITAPSAMIESVCSIEQRMELDRLFGLFADKNTEEAEIIATLFAAWNDFLIDGKSPTDDAIVQEVRKNWHERKARFSPEELHKWLRWLKQKDLVPSGKSSQTVYQRQLIH